MSALERGRRVVHFVNVADLVDPDDPEGRTWREINAAKTHAIAVGTLVELESGVRLWVVHHSRDCDQTPLYCLGPVRADTTQQETGFSNPQWINGYPEESLAVVKPAKGHG